MADEETPTGTAYDLLQDVRLDDIESVLDNSVPEPSGNQISYPIVNQGISASMWQTIAAGMGNGVISWGGGPYEITDLRNTDDTAKVNVSAITGTADGLLAGFYHRLLESMRVSLPAVSETTTYYICLTYDPLRESAPDGPVSIQVWRGGPPESQGKRHIIISEVRREPDQLLTDAAVTRRRPTISPTQWVLREAHKPDPATQLWGACVRVHETGKTYVACSDQNSSGIWAGRPDRWEELTPSSGWKTLMPADTGGVWSGSYAAYKVEGNRVSLRGKIYRSPSMKAGKTYSPRNSGYPEDARPRRKMNFPASGYIIPSSGAIYGFPADVMIGTAGELQVTNQRDGILVGVSLDGITYLID